MTEKTITITLEHYRKLLKASYFLSCLEEAGVDNWGGYGDAQALFNADEEEE